MSTSVTINKPAPVQTIEIKLVKSGDCTLVTATDNQTGYTYKLVKLDSQGRLQRFRDIPASLGFTLDHEGRLKVNYS